jgi:hypothetical protein
MSTRTTNTNGPIEWTPASPRMQRRRPDFFDRAFALILGGAMVTALLLAVAVALGAIWLIVVVVQDLARRVGG